MKEIEVKILEIDKLKIESKLKKLGAKKVFSGKLVSYFFDRNNTLKDKNILLRLRVYDNECLLTAKKIISKKDIKDADEFEVNVSNFKEARKLLELLGFKLIRKLEKNRVSYVLNNVKFEFDKPKEKVPCFLEIEAKDKKTLEKYVKLLGYRMSQTNTFTYSDVLQHYGVLR